MSDRVLVGGAAMGEALVLDQPLSFWGGLDVGRGVIIDRHHPQRGAVVSRRIMVMPGSRGSSSSSSVLAEALRRGTGPAGIVLRRPDEIVVLGALVVQLLDGRACPVVCLDGPRYDKITSGDLIAIDDAGRVTVEHRTAGPEAA